MPQLPPLPSVSTSPPTIATGANYAVGTVTGTNETITTSTPPPTTTTAATVTAIATTTGGTGTAISNANTRHPSLEMLVYDPFVCGILLFLSHFLVLFVSFFLLF